MSVFAPMDHFKVTHQFRAGTWQNFTGSLVGVQLNLREWEDQHSGSLSFYNDTMNPALSSGTRVIKKGDRVRVSMRNNSGTWRRTTTFAVRRVDCSKQDFTKVVGRQILVTVHLRVLVGVAGVGGAG